MKKELIAAQPRNIQSSEPWLCLWLCHPRSVTKDAMHTLLKSRHFFVLANFATLRRNRFKVSRKETQDTVVRIRTNELRIILRDFVWKKAHTV